MDWVWDGRGSPINSRPFDDYQFIKLALDYEQNICSLHSHSSDLEEESLSGIY